MWLPRIGSVKCLAAGTETPTRQAPNLHKLEQDGFGGYLVGLVDCAQFLAPVRLILQRVEVEIAL
jgi:hypothetical protein